MSLLKERAVAMRTLEKAVENLLQANDFGGVIKSPKYIRLCKSRARLAKKKLDDVEKKLSKINNHCFSPRIEMIAKLMAIFKPEIKKEIEDIVTFT